MKQTYLKISAAILNLVYPIYCQGCGIRLSFDNKNYICQECLNKIKFNEPPFCIRCGRVLSGSKDSKALCADCLTKDYYFCPAWQCCQYEGLMRELIHNFKYNRRLFLKNLFVGIMHRFINDYIEDYKKIDGLVPVPMHRDGIAKRGFNQALLLSKELSKILNLPVFDNSLIKIKNTKQQIGLNRKERFLNIKGAFSIVRDSSIKAKSLLLIDDVFTTGATCNECSKELIEAGADSVMVLALARGI